MPVRKAFLLGTLAGLLFFLSGCNTAQSASPRRVERPTTALLIVPENGKLDAGQIAAEREQVLAYLRDRGIVSAADVLVDDLSTADRIVRVVIGADGGYKISIFGENPDFAAAAPAYSPRPVDESPWAYAPYSLAFLGAGYLYYDYGWPYSDYWSRHGSAPYGPRYPGYVHRPPTVVITPPPAKPERPSGSKPDRPGHNPRPPHWADRPDRPNPRAPAPAPDGAPERPEHRPGSPRPERPPGPEGRRDWSRPGGERRTGANPDRVRGQPPATPPPRPSPRPAPSPETPRPIVAPMTPPATFTPPPAYVPPPPPPPSPPPSLHRGDSGRVAR